MGNWWHFCRWQQKNREEGHFHKYAEEVKQGLTEHEFTQPFQLNEDLKQQDKLTTWIKYLDFEYWWYNKDMRFIKCHQPQYDKAWKKLVNLKVLRPLNMKKFICNIESAFQHTSEREQAEKAVKFTKLAVMSVEKAITDSWHSSLFKTEAQQWLAAAQSKLNAALKTLKLIKRWNDLVYDFHKMTEQLKIIKNKLIESYLTWRKDTERCIKLLRWILQQVLLIELELKVITNYSIQRNMRVQWRLKRNHTYEFNEEWVSKQQRQNNEISDCRTHTFTVKKLENQHKHSCDDLLNEEEVIKQCKHNG